MHRVVKPISLAIVVALAAACAPKPEPYEAALPLPQPPKASAVAHLKPAEACAALAGNPLEPRANGRGVFLAQIDFRAALKSCDAALENGKGKRIDYYNRARALHAGMLRVSDAEFPSWSEKTLAAYETAADKGHPYAIMSLAELRSIDLPNKPKNLKLSARLREMAFKKLGKAKTWWPETQLYVGLYRLRGEDFLLKPLSQNPDAGAARSAISNAARGGMVRHLSHQYDSLWCDDFTGPAPGDARGEVCELFLTTMAENGMVRPAAQLAVRKYNEGVRVAQRYGVRHNDARTGYSNGKFWANKALEAKVDPDEHSLQLARQVRDTVISIETRIDRQDRVAAALGKALFGSRASSGYAQGSVETDHLTDSHKNGTCLGAGLTGDVTEIIANSC